jgi:PTS system nitrogen regulatory IIA component
MLATSDTSLRISSPPFPEAATRMSGSCLATTLELSDIYLDLAQSEKYPALEAVAQRVSTRHGLSTDEVYARLRQREEIGSTGLGRGLALPHARVSGLKRPITAFVRLRNPVPFAAPDGVPVEEMLLLLMPQDAANRHLLLVVRLAEMCCAASFREGIRACASEHQIRTVLNHALRL